MKKVFIFTSILAVLIGCAKEEQLFEKPVLEEGGEQAPALTFNFSINHSSLDNPATKAVKSGWEAGDKVFVFFSTVAAPKHLELTFDGTDWTATEMDGKDPGSLGLTEDGTMTAVYLPFGNDAIVKTKSGRFAFDQTDYAYYLSCVNVPYTVSGDVVSGTLDMNVPDGFVQFFFVDGDAEDGNALLREAHITPKAVTGVNSDGTLVIESKDEGTQMPGFVYGEDAAKGYLFSGELADVARGVSTAYHFNMVRGAVSKVLEGTKTLYNGTAGNYTQRAIKFPAISAWASGDDEPIEFADANIKTKVVESFDTSGDGELSYTEARNVTSATNFKTAFGELTIFKSFDEFRFFTGLVDIPKDMFNGWTLLTSIVMPETIQNIGEAAFQNCEKLSRIVIPDSVESIARYAFSGCHEISSIIIPDGVTTINFRSFASCNSLSSITIPQSVLEIKDRAFEGCVNICHLYIDSIDSWLRIPVGYGSSPIGVTSQPVHLYVSGAEVSHIDIPNSVTIIKAGKFRNCAFITDITFPTGIMSIENVSFAGCASLTSFEIPESVLTIGFMAFADCSSLISITILANTVPTGATSMFFGTPCIIYVPAGSVDDYKEAEYWSDYADSIQPIP